MSWIKKPMLIVYAPAAIGKPRAPRQIWQPRNSIDEFNQSAKLSSATEYRKLRDEIQNFSLFAEHRRSTIMDKWNLPPITPNGEK